MKRLFRRYFYQFQQAFRTVVCLCLCGSLFFTSFQVAFAQEAVPEVHFQTKKVFTDIQGFFFKHIESPKSEDEKEGGQGGEGQGVLQKRIVDKLTPFKESFFDPSQDYKPIIWATRQEARLLDKAFEEAFQIQKSVEDYLNTNSVPPQERSMVLNYFLDNLYIPMRRLTLIMMDHEPGFFEWMDDEGIEKEDSRAIKRREKKQRMSFSVTPYEERGVKAFQRLEKLIDLSIPAEVFLHDPRVMDEFQGGGVQALLGGGARGLLPVEREDGTYGLAHNPEEQLRRDIPLILGAPSTATYVRALKWDAIDNLFSQVKESHILLNESGEIPVPAACQIPENGNLSSGILASAHPYKRELEFARLLMNHGVFSTFLKEEDFGLLGFSEDLSEGLVEGMEVNQELMPILESFSASQKLLEDHIDYLTEIPGMSIENRDMYGLLPFEQLEKVDFALADDLDNNGRNQKPFFDDLQSFSVIYPYLLQKSSARLQKIVLRHSPDGRGINDGPKLSREAAEHFQKSVVLWTPSEEEGGFPGETSDRIFISKGEDEGEWFNAKGFTQLQVDLMQEKGTTDIMSLIDPRYVGLMKRSLVEYEFPPYYSSTNMKRFALEELLPALHGLEGLFVKEEQRKSHPHHQALKKTLSIIMDSPFLRERFSREAPQGEEGKYFFKGLLSLLDPYGDLAQSSRFPHKAVSSEMLQQIWPDLKKIYNTLVKKGVIKKLEMSEYDYIKEQVYGMGYRDKNPWAILKLSFYLAKSNEEHFSSLGIHQFYLQFISPMGLHLPMGPFFAEKVLQNKKDRQHIWGLMQQLLDSQNNFLFRTKVSGKPGHHYYDLMQYVATTPIITKERFEDISLDLFSESKIFKGEEYFSKADRYFDDVVFKSADQLYKIYMTENPQEKEELIKDYIQRYEIGANYKAKRHFLQADFYSKYLIYRELIGQAAWGRKQKHQQRIEDICLMEHDEVEEYRRTFFSLGARQEVLNEQYGVKEMPPGAEQKSGSQAKRDIKVLKHAGLMLPPFLLSSVIAGTGCVMSAGLLCAVVLGGMTVWFSYHGYKMFDETLRQHIESKAMERKMEDFKEVGMTDDKNISQFSRSIALVLIEAVGTLAFVGYVTKFAMTVGKTAVTGLGTFLRGEKMLPQLIAHANHWTSLYESKRILGLASLLKDVKNNLTEGAMDFFKRSFRRNGMVKGMKAQGGYDHFRLGHINHMRDLPNEKELVNAVADTFDLYFKGNLQTMRSSLHRYTKPDRKLELLRGKLAALAQGGDSRRALGRVKKIQKKLDFQKQLKGFTGKMDKAIKEGTDLSSFVKQHIDDLVIIKDLPFKLREIPHYILFDGMPLVRMRTPFYTRLVEGVMMKRVMTAYDNLLGERIRREVAHIVSGGRALTIHNNYQFMEQAFKEIAKRVEEGRLSKKTIGELEKYKAGVVKKISVPSKAMKEYPHLLRDEGALKETLFAPQNRVQRALAETIWNSNALEKLIKDEYLAKFSRNALKELNKVQRGSENKLDDLNLSFSLVRIMMGTSRPKMIL